MSKIDLPVNFEDIKVLETKNFKINNRIVNMAINIKRSDDGKAEAFLGGYLQSNTTEFLKCDTNSHNWIFYNETVYPLPNDAPTVFKEFFDGMDSKNISARKLFELKKNESQKLKIFFDDNLTHKITKSPLRKPNGLKADLYAYQDVGWSYISYFLKQNRGIILADEMGLGKTLQIIAWICSLEIDHEAPVLIICPSSLLKNWTREIIKFAPKLSFIVHHGAHRSGIYSSLQVADIVLSTYETVNVDLSLFTAFTWRAVVCDEAQALKTPNSKRRKSVSELVAQNFIAITGTPIENSLTDIWSILDLAEPNMLGNLENFIEDFPDEQESGRKLSYAIEPFLLRRSVKEVADDLPSRVDIDIPITMTTNDASEYRKILEETKLEYPRAAGLVATIRLQIFCTHPSLRSSGNSVSDYENARFDNSRNIEFQTPKMDLATSIIKEAFHAGEKVLVFSQFNGVAEIFKYANLTDKSFYFGKINGSTEVSERQDIIDEFTDYKGTGLLVLNPKAAGVGLNITAANVVLHFSPIWNPALEDQASARSFRRGQDKPVRVYHLFYEQTVEEVMMNRLLWKRSLGAEITPTSSRDNDDLLLALELRPE